MPSSFAGGRHFFWTVSHFTLSQSACARQPWPTGHFGAFAPPQSSPVSSPFLTPSVGDGTWQIPDLHTLLVQSAPITQPLLSGHAGALRAAAVDVRLVAVLHAVGGDDVVAFPVAAESRCAVERALACTARLAQRREATARRAG